MKIRFNTLSTRILMVVFWIATIFLFLFLPFFSGLLYEKKSLNIFVWPMILDAKVLHQFEKETGIKVYVNYYETSAELYSKLKATEGAGYDLIAPSDYLVERLIQENRVQALDKTKLTFLSDIHPYFLGHYFDPSNAYSLPYYMGVFGLGINKDYFKNNPVHPVSWKSIFDASAITYPICMTDDPRQAIMLATYYLYKSIDALKDSNNIPAIKRLLIEQKKSVEVYTDARVEELLASGSCPIALGLSSDVWKVMKEYDAIDFVVPEGAMFVAMESFVIPKKSQKTEMVYQLLNFLYRPDVIRTNSLLYGFCPPLKDVSVEAEKIYCITEKDRDRMEFLRNVVPEKILHDIWISVMSL